MAYSDIVNKRAEQKALTVNVKFTDEQIDEIIEKAKEKFINEQQQD